MRFIGAIWLMGLILFCPGITHGEELSQPPHLIVGDFSRGDLSGWEEKEFGGRTIYQITELNGQRVLEARARDTASGQFRKIRIDLHETPYLNWSWRIENRLDPLPEQNRAGDDYSARIYVVIDGGLFFWRTRALNYVWSSQTESGRIWANAYAGENAMMLALRTRADDTGIWYHEKRDVRHDLQTIFGEEIRYIDAVALMTDTDDSNGEAHSYYGEIFFTAE